MNEAVKRAPLTLGDAAVEKASALCRKMEADARFPLLCETLGLFGQGWFDTPIAEAPPFRNDITDDGSPFEFSLAFAGDKVEVRVLAEAQCAPFNATSNWNAASRLHRALARYPEVDLARFDAVAELFEPPVGAQARFGIWHAANISAAGERSFKLYLNPQVRGPNEASQVVREALERLDCGAAWHALNARLESIPDSELTFFSLDMARGPRARVKVYVAHPGATAREVDCALLGTRGYEAGDAQRWTEAMTGGAGPFPARPLLTCFSFYGAEEMPTGTLHLPVRCYTGSDADVLERLTSLLPATSLERLRESLIAMSGRALDTGRGLVTYVSIRRERGQLRVTTYLAPQLYAIAAPRTSLLPGDPSFAPQSSFVQALSSARGGGDLKPTMLTVQDAIARQQSVFAQHPFLRRLETDVSMQVVRAMTESLTFFVLAFQDVLRLTRTLSTHPVLREMAHTHELEDKGHEQWFLDDAVKLGAARDLRWAFSETHSATRDVGYRLVAEVLRASDDRARMAVVLSLEAVGAEFFGRIIRRLDALGCSEGLSYFARPHQAVEQGHEVFESDVQDRLLSVTMSPRLLEEALASVDRTFAAMRALADHVEARAAQADRRDAAE